MVVRAMASISMSSNDGGDVMDTLEEVDSELNGSVTRPKKECASTSVVPVPSSSCGDLSQLMWMKRIMTLKVASEATMVF